MAIARAVPTNPAVLLCDEPAGAFDSATGVVVLDVLENMNRELGTLTVLITHTIGIVDRVMLLSTYTVKIAPDSNSYVTAGGRADPAGNCACGGTRCFSKVSAVDVD